jgi:hypothetical protein
MIVIRVSRRRRIRPRNENRIQMRRMKMDEDAVGPRGNHEKEYDSSLNHNEDLITQSSSIPTSFANNKHVSLVTPHGIQKKHLKIIFLSL